MRRLRVTATMKKQLADAKSGKARGGVFLIPRKKSLDEWEKEAIPAQQLLLASVRH
jgi:hypothetical protein